MFLKALRNVAETERMSSVAMKAGVSRESLYGMLSEKGNPRLNNLHAVLNVLGLRISIEAATTYSPTIQAPPPEAVVTIPSATTNIETRARAAHSSEHIRSHRHQTATPWMHVQKIQTHGVRQTALVR